MKLAACLLLGTLLGWTGRDAAIVRWQANIARLHALTAKMAAQQSALAARVCEGALVEHAILRREVS